jgi:sugar/nucleoside kinase (ribokinase family)
MCLRQVQLVTITAKDMAALPPEVLRGVRAGKPGGPALVVKRDVRGVSIIVNGECRNLPPPTLQMPVRTDAGAGDVLLGGLAVHLSRSQESLSIDRVQQAYEACRPAVAGLLSSASVSAYVQELRDAGLVGG